MSSTSTARAELKHWNVGDRLEDGREVAYVVPNGNSGSWDAMTGRLRLEGMTPSHAAAMLSDGRYADVIALPPEQVPTLHGLQRANPARFGNAPEVVKHLATKWDHLVLVIADTTLAAFEDTGREAEISRIVWAAANKLTETARSAERRGPVQVLGDKKEHLFELDDLNGNIVGHVEVFAHDAPLEYDIPQGSVRIIVSVPPEGLGAGEMRSVAHVLHEASAKIETGVVLDLLHGADGQVVGRLEVSPLPQPKAALEQRAEADHDRGLEL